MIGVAAEYDALRRHAVAIDRSDRGRIRFSGAKAGQTLDGLVTNDVGSLPPGRGVYAAALTPKGKIVADLRIFAFDGSIMADCPPEAWEGWWSLVRKYVNPKWSTYGDERASIHDLGIFGLEAPAAVAALTGVGVAGLLALDSYAHETVDVGGGGRVTIARVPDLNVDGYEIFGDPHTIAALRERASQEGIRTASNEAWEIARIEAGRPAWGLDMDETTIPQEANLDALDAISYTKGCYTGQEVVARLHFRGHVNRRLMGLRVPTAEPPRRGSILFDATGKQVGDVRSATSSPRLGGIALGMVRREIEAGGELIARGEGDEQTVHVASLPFPV